VQKRLKGVKAASAAKGDRRYAPKSPKSIG
jgi:hypothetical protein